MMPDYTVTVEINIPITARNDEQAWERSDRIEEWVKLEVPSGAKWAGDFDIQSTVVED